MTSEDTKIVKSGIWYTVAAVLTKGMIYLTTPIFTRWLTHEEFGIFSHYSSWLSTVTVFITLSLESTFISARFDFKERFDEYILSALSLSTLVAGIWFLIYNAAPAFFENWLELDSIYILIMLCYLVFLPAVNMFQTRERYLYRYRVSVFLSLLLAAATTVFSIFFVYALDNKVLGRILGSAAPTVIIGGILYIVLIFKGKRINIKDWAYALPICLPYIPHVLSLTLLFSMDRIMITKFCGAEDTALYSVAYNCGAVITLLSTSLNTATSPWLGQKLQSNATDEIRKRSKQYICIFIFFVIGLMLISPEILFVMGGRSYSSAIYVMPPIALGYVCQFFYTLYVNVEQYKKKTVGMAWASVFSAALNFVLNYLLIPRYGYTVAAYTTFVSFLCLLILHMILVKKLGYSSIYPMKFMMLLLCGMGAYTAVTYVLYAITVLRVLTLGVYIAVCSVIFVKNRRTVLEILKSK